MATKVKTTVTFTYTFLSDNEDRAIRSLRSWVNEQVDGDVQLVQDSDTGEYTYLDTSVSVGKTFKFKTPAEFITKYGKAESVHTVARAMVDYGMAEGVTATTETIEVKEDK